MKYKKSLFWFSAFFPIIAFSTPVITSGAANYVYSLPNLAGKATSVPLNQELDLNFSLTEQGNLVANNIAVRDGDNQDIPLKLVVNKTWENVKSPYLKSPMTRTENLRFIPANGGKWDANKTYSVYLNGAKLGSFTTGTKYVAY